MRLFRSTGLADGYQAIWRDQCRAKAVRSEQTGSLSPILIVRWLFFLGRVLQLFLGLVVKLLILAERLTTVLPKPVRPAHYFDLWNSTHLRAQLGHISRGLTLTENMGRLCAGLIIHPRKIA
jgi:hypothetical protein